MADKSNALILVRKLELEAYSSVVTALRAHGDLSDRGKTMLDELRDLFSISQERHKAEMRRVANDDELATLAEKAMGSITCEKWLAEGKRILPPFPRIDPETAFSRLANTASKKQVKIEMEKFFQARDLLERAVKKQEESRASALENDRMETKRRLAELAPATSSEAPATSEETKTTKGAISASHRKRVRVCSPQPSPGVDAELGIVSSETSAPAKAKKPKEPKEHGGKKQRLRMSPSGNSSVQENVPADETNGSLPPSSLAISSPVKVSTDSLDPISPLATPGQLVQNVDLFANDHPHHAIGDVSGSAEKFNKSSPKSPKPPKEKKPKQTKKQKAAAAAASAAPLKDTVAENAGTAMPAVVSSSSYSASPPVTLSGVGISRTAQHSSLMQQQAAAVAAAAAATTHSVAPHSHTTQTHQPQQGSATVVISSTNQVVVSSPHAQGNLVQASPGKVVQSSYHNYAPPLAPLSINPMRLVGRAGPGIAISTATAAGSAAAAAAAAAASPPSIAVNTVRSQQEPAANIPLIRLTPQNSQQLQRPPLIVATGGVRPTAILTPGPPGAPGVLTIRSHRPTLTPVTTTTQTSVRPSIVIHQAPTSGGQPTFVMKKIGPVAPNTTPTSAAATTNVPTIHSSISTTSVPVLQNVTAAGNRPIIISSTPGANGSVLVINKQQLQPQIPTTRPTILTTPTPPPQPPQQPIQQQQQQHIQPTPPQQPAATVVVASASLTNLKANSVSNFSYASNFQVAAKQVNDLYGAECDMSSPPAVGAESVVETSHDILTNGTSGYENGSTNNTITTTTATATTNNNNNFDHNNSNNTAGLVLLQQAAAAIGDSPTGDANVVELSNFIVDSKDLADQDLARYEDVVAEVGTAYHGTGTNMTSGAPSHDAELYNEDLMMAIMNSNPTTGQHRQSQPS